MDDCKDCSAEIVADATYRSYCYNRKRSPNVPLDSWLDLYGPKAIEFERRYRNELTKRDNPV